MNHEQRIHGYTVEAQLRNELLAYLTTRPWQEVNTLIVALVRAKQATASPPEPRPSGSDLSLDSP